VVLELNARWVSLCPGNVEETPQHICTFRTNMHADYTSPLFTSTICACIVKIFERI
jgi:hypothetical protein